MPAFSVYVDNILVVTVNCEKLDVFSVRVSGTRVEEEFASLGVSGGAYPEGGESTNLTWVNEVPLEPGQSVRVLFAESGTTSAQGKTIEELFPEADPEESFDFTPTKEMFEELKAKSKQRVGYSFEYCSPEGKTVKVSTTQGEHGFSFTVLWNSQRQSRARVALNSYTVESLQQHEPGTYHVQEHFQFGQAVAIIVGA